MQLDFKSGIAENYLQQGNACYRSSDYVKQLEYLNKVLSFFTRTKNKVGVEKCYNQFAEVYYAMRNLVEVMDYCLIGA